MKVGIFGGCFNPIHFGHVSLIQEVVSDFSFDKILIIPNMNPYYKKHTPVSFQSVSNMIELAIPEGITFEISSLESSPNMKHTTYETLRSLAKNEVGNEMYLIIGSDQFLEFSNWNNSQEINKIAHMIVAVRGSHVVDIDESNLLNNAYIEVKSDSFARCFVRDKNRELFFYNLKEKFDISSTAIQDMLSHGKIEEVKKFIHPTVLSFILEKGLYIK